VNVSEFKNIESLGLRIKSKMVMQKNFDTVYDQETLLYIDPADLEKLLSEGVRVYGHKEHRYWDDHSPSDCSELLPGTCYRNKDFTGLLIGIKPIEKPDTAEELLRELIAAQKFSHLNITYIPEEWAERAKKLLGDK